MRILQLHCDSIEYTPTKKEIKTAEENVSTETTRLEELVVAFVAIEKEDPRPRLGARWIVTRLRK